MLKRFRNLDKPWKEILYACSGFGPNLLMVLMGAFFTDAVNPSALGITEETAGNAVQTITGACLIFPILFSVLWFIGKAFDGLIDIPFASITDTLKTKWGKRRPPILICSIPMVVSYAMCWIPIMDVPFGAVGDAVTKAQIINTVWIFFWALIFFATYTMCLIAFYGSLSTVCADEKQRVRVSSYKSFFDTISYVIVYALVPLILGKTGLHVDKLVFILLPLMVTIIIPLFMIKEGDKWEAKAKAEGYDVTPLAEEPRVGIRESLKLTFTNKPFMWWVLVNSCAFFGLQMFLSSMNTLILGGMNLTSSQMAILNTCAFAPVPLMLYLFNKLKQKKGIRFAYQTCLLSFAVCIMAFVLGGQFVMGDNVTVKIIIGSAGGVVGSWAIGSFFMMPFLIPSQVAAVEEKLTGKNHSAMFFAAQSVATTVVGAVASGLVYENIKNIWFSRTASGVQWAQDINEAAKLFGVTENINNNVFNLSWFLVPAIVSLMCIVGFIVAFKMPRNFGAKEVAKKMGMEDVYLAKKDLFPDEPDYPFEGESLIVNNTLWVLTGSIFGFVWNYGILKAVNTFAKKKIGVWHFILSIFIPFYGAYLAVRLSNEIHDKCVELGIQSKKLTAIHVIFNLLYINLVSESILQHKLNKIAEIQNKALEAATETVTEGEAAAV